MRNLTLILLLCASLGAAAQSSLLYEISGNGLDEKCYLFGTIHMEDEAAFQWNEKVFEAIDACETAAFELDFDIQELSKQFDTTMFQKIFFYMVEDLVPALMETYPPDVLADNLIDHMLPFYKDLISVKMGGERRMMVVDQFLQQYAESQGKNVWGIETLDEQIQAIVGSDLSSLTEALVSVFDSTSFMALSNYSGEQQSLLDAYASLNMDAVCGLIDKVGDVSNPWSSKLWDRLLNQRNDVMVERITSRMQDESVFVAVGAGHLCGPTGLVNQLENKGYTLRPVNIHGPKEPLRLDWRKYEGDGFTTLVPEGVDSIEHGWSFFPTMEQEDMPRTLFTSHGIAVFKVEQYETAEEAVAFDEWDMMDDSPDAPAEVMIQDEAVEIAVEEAEETEVVVESVEPYEFEEIDEDEPMIEDGGMYERRTPASPFAEVLGSVNPMEHVTPEMQAYFMQAFMRIQMKAPDFQQQLKPFTEGILESETEEEIVEINGQEVVLIKQFSSFSNSITATIESPDGSMYELSIYGDPMVIRSPEILMYFTKFKLK